MCSHSVPEAPHDSTPFLSVIIPAYNEAQRLGRFLPEALDWLDSQGRNYEVLLVDDGSTDNTAEVALSLGSGRPLRVLKQTINQGKGAAIRRGMLEAQGSVRVFTDADFSSPIEELLKLLASLERGADVAIGSRALADSRLEVRQPFFRELSGRFFNLLVRTLLLPGIMDTQCGFKAFRAEVADTIFAQQKLAGFAFDVEILMLARRADFSIAEVPVRWTNDPASKVSLKAGLAGFRDLLRLKWLH
jgi:dolichyl-phosphate beta-glucosyltransferase